jgi:[ribosomal protein S18]-alanine N-acetyltransferase
VTQVRAAGIDDVPAVVRLEDECLGVDAWSEGLVREGIAGALPTVVYLVAEIDDAVVGHAVVSTAGDIAELQRIAVGAAHRRSGVASALLTEVLEVAGRTEADRLLLEVRADNQAALAFYARSGFTEIDRRPRYYADGATAVVLRLAGIRGTGTMAR